MLGYPLTPPPPPGSLAADRPTRRPPSFGSTKGGGGDPPPYSPQNCCSPLGVTHWLAAAPVNGCCPPSSSSTTPSLRGPWPLLVSGGSKGSLGQNQACIPPEDNAFHSRGTQATWGKLRVGPG